MASTSDYARARGGKLKLKGKKSLFKADNKKRKRKLEEEETKKSDPDAELRGGWWLITEESDLKGGVNIAFECGSGSRSYLAAMDNGRFTVGGPHPDGEEPSPEEIMILIKTPDEAEISLKTGYGKYIGVDSEGNLVAVADAVGARERLVVVFQGGKSAVQSVSNGLFLSMKPDADGYVRVVSRKAGDEEMVQLRTNATKEGPVDWRSADDKKPAKECETAYVKMYQHSKVSLKGKHISINVNDPQSIQRAQQDGTLHEYLLDRRAKMKSDKYC